MASRKREIHNMWLQLAEIFHYGRGHVFQKIFNKESSL